MRQCRRILKQVELFAEAGFAIEVTQITRREKLPIERSSLAASFREIPDEELSICGLHVLLR